MKCTYCGNDCYAIKEMGTNMPMSNCCSSKIKFFGDANEKTLRDEIAIEVMKMFLCSDTIDMEAGEIVDASYEYADKMLERRQE